MPVFSVTVLLLWAGCFIGYLLNLFHTITGLLGLTALSNLADMSVMTLLGTIGIFFPPLGCVMGWVQAFA